MLDLRHLMPLGFSAGVVAIFFSAVSFEARALEFKVLHSLDGGRDGERPNGDLIMGGDGALYGTSIGGPYYENDPFSPSKIFKVTPSGEMTIIRVLKGGEDGRFPLSGLTSDGAGGFYGTTATSVFHAPSGRAVAKLASLPKNFSKFFNSPSRLLKYKGSLYGTEAAARQLSDRGIVFKLDPNKQLRILHTFESGTSDGDGPTGPLVADDRGNLFGVTIGGGKFNQGTAFKIGPGDVYSVFHHFKTASTPVEGMVRDASGNFYGICYSGSIYELTADGQEKILFQLASDGSQGRAALGGLVRDAAGNLYGTTQGGGGSCNCGVVFKLTPSGKFSVLHAFNKTDGAYPTGSLFLDGNGNLFGAARSGGSKNLGVIFEIAK